MGFKIRKGKRAVAPIIATFLLLFLAVGLGILVMNWGRASLEANSKCSIDTGLCLIELNQQPQICIGGSGEHGYVTFLLENGPNVNIEQLQLRIIGEKKVYVSELSESSIPKGYPLKKTIPYNFNLFGEPKQFKITPKLALFPKEPPILCPEQAIVIEDIRRC